MRITTFTALLAACSIYGAEAAQSLPEKAWFNSVSLDKYKHSDKLALGVSSSYYFAPQSSSGTLDDWGYIDTDSSVSVGYSHYDGSNASSVGGEFFLKQFIVSGAYSDDSGDNASELGLGYLVNDQLKLKVNREHQNKNTDYSYSAQYQHDLADGDYLGFAVTFGEQDSLSARYFANVNGSDHVTLDVSYNHSDDDNDTSALAKYYVGQQYAFGAGVADGKAVLTGNYFFSDEYYLTFNYSNDNTTLGFVGQF
jgi:hypothetical protein